MVISSTAWQNLLDLENGRKALELMFGKRINSSILLAVLVALTVSFCGKKEAEAKTGFHKLDKDHNKSLTIEEVLAPGEARFANLDLDKNGSLAKEEAKVPDARFVRLDKDKNGAIDQEEWQTPARNQFKASDSDNNDELSESEWSNGKLNK